MRLNWQDEVIFPQEAASRNIRQLEKACQVLSEGNITDALKVLYRVDNNMYAFLLMKKYITISPNTFFTNPKIA